MIFNTKEGQDYLKNQNLDGFQNNITHLVWTTGGRFLPEEEFLHYKEMGAKVQI